MPRSTLSTDILLPMFNSLLPSAYELLHWYLKHNISIALHAIQMDQVWVYDPHPVLCLRVDFSTFYFVSCSTVQNEERKMLEELPQKL